MDAKHTPGPWFVEEQSYRSSSFYIRGSDKNGNQLAWAKGAVAHIPRSTVMPSEANARLMAAAPELLACVESAIKWMQGDKWRDSPDIDKRLAWETQMDELKRIYNKATGETV